MVYMYLIAVALVVMLVAATILLRSRRIASGSLASRIRSLGPGN